ncbi:hypothetical protein [Magnetospirillum molischianum]|uniref:Uncharacterized protein n=1 Tax=Magnetospirillum molischianum DSM 120 TaxID=1150626 RepID=H8FXN0_MAGML|nr:hypothetical protein [Magnetospirillum molischianum]CCG43118.1 conserved exported hypothetical protein [Magnetospirillum molischianum DSM 120]
MFIKILLLVLVVSVVWFGFRHMTRVAEMIVRRGGESDKRRETAPTETMTECRVCGVWQPSRSASPCGRADCPY